ncbi:MAG: DMT family transporter [Pseudomonadota bacterium]
MSDHQGITGHQASLPAGRPLALWLVLAGVGLSWGGTYPLSKIVVDAGHHPIGINFLGTVIGAVIVTCAMIATGRRLPLDRRHLIFYAICGITGTALPHTLGYYGYQVLPVGIIAIVTAIVPITTFLAALLLRMERPEPLRLLGLSMGLGAVAVLTVPKTSLPSPEMALWIVLPVIVGLSYTVENVYIARAQPDGLDAMQTMTGLFWAATAWLLPVTAATGTWMPVGRFDGAELALLGATMGHLAAYSGFVWLIRQAGPVFAAQVSYIVTLTGVFLGILVFGESHSAWVWGALAMVLGGLALVQPRR